MNCYKLPIDADPLVRCYLQPGYSIAVLNAENKTFINQICNEFINVSVEENSQRFYLEFCTSTYFFDDLKNCKHYSYCTLNMTFENIHMTNTFYQKTYDTVGYIIDMITSGYYVIGYWDEFYVPEKNAFQKYHFSHHYLAYGYDLGKKIMHIMGYDKMGIYKNLDVPFDDFERSIFSKGLKEMQVQFVKSNNLKYEIDFLWIKLEINNYLNSVGGQFELPNRVYGVKAWKKLFSYLNNLSSDENIDLRFVRGFMEHKNLMQLRMERLYKNEYISCEKLITYYNELNELSKTVFLLSMKYNITKKASILFKINKYINQIIDKEPLILKEIFNV
ncbi:MAG TPA: hypothetical protein VIK86_06195 [Candidatus Paceibacterota bacterium]